MKTYIQEVIERFNRLSLIEQIRSHLRAAEFLSGDPAARRRALDEVSRLRAQMKTQEAPAVTRSAAGTTRPEMTKRIDVSDGFMGNAGPQPKEESPLLHDPDYMKARAAGDTEAMARIAAEFGRRKR